MEPIRELHYRVEAPVLGHFPGHHRSPRGDSGFEFRGHVRLLDAPDPRRLDLHASLRDPFGDWKVRVYSQPKAIPVVMVADLSASMGFEGTRRKLDVLAAFVDSLAWSAWRTGDSFGFIGCDAGVRADFLQLPTRARGVGGPLAQRLRGWQPQRPAKERRAAPEFLEPPRGAGRAKPGPGGDQARSAQGLLGAQRFLGRQRALVFLVSDFHLPLRLVDDVLASLAAHDVVPVVLWDPAEFGLTALHGLAQVVDPETGRERLLWWRPMLRARWQQARAQRHDELQHLFRARRLKPLFIEGAFDAEAVTRHFHS